MSVDDSAATVAIIKRQARYNPALVEALRLSGLDAWCPTVRRYWIYFRGTSNGEYIEAASMSLAKRLFADRQGISPLSSYIAGRRKP